MAGHASRRSDRVERVGPVIDEFDERLDFNDLRVNRAGYLDRLDGLMYGDNPEQGIVRGRNFLHPVLRFALQFPDRWEVINTPAQVVARQPGEEVYMVLQLVTEPAPLLYRAYGDTWQSIAEDAGQSIIPSNTLAVMNGVSVNEQPRRGDRIKIAVEGN